MNEDILQIKNLEFDFGCGNCSISDLNCAQCNDGALCNTEMFFKKVLYCWRKDSDDEKPLSLKKECKSECFTLRDFNGEGLLKHRKYFLSNKLKSNKVVAIV